MEIKLDDFNFKNAVSEAILKSLDETKREQLIKSALEYLLTKSTSSYNKTSPLEDAFRSAVMQETREITVQYLKDNAEFNTVIQGIIAEAVQKIATDSRANVVGKIADKIIEGLYSDR